MKIKKKNTVEEVIFVQRLMYIYKMKFDCHLESSLFTPHSKPIPSTDAEPNLPMILSTTPNKRASANGFVL